ncbi:MAG: hypothetical protein KC620_23045 [Myxococcales bacterium]|nr:hypothetical protein [Myxococcales bacterium]
MSLRILFLLMGLVTTAMIAAVVQMKVLTPPAEQTVTVGEQSAIDRVCYTHCSEHMAELASNQPSAEIVRQRVNACLDECRYRASGGRLGAHVAPAMKF